MFLSELENYFNQQNYFSFQTLLEISLIFVYCAFRVLDFIFTAVNADRV